MAAKVSSADAVVVAAGEAKTEVLWATCACCGLTEECTPAYIARVRERYSGRWVCGLCGEAVKDEIGRAGKRITTEEALNRHTAFSMNFRSAVPAFDTAEPLITAMRQLIRRSLESQQVVRSTPGSPNGKPAMPSTGDARRHPCSVGELLLHTGSLKNRWRTPPPFSNKIKGKIQLLDVGIKGKQ